MMVTFSFPFIVAGGSAKRPWRNRETCLRLTGKKRKIKGPGCQSGFSTQVLFSHHLLEGGRVNNFGL